MVKPVVLTVIVGKIVEEAVASYFGRSLSAGAGKARITPKRRQEEHRV
jgi:hypothetical protein